MHLAQCVYSACADRVMVSTVEKDFRGREESGLDGGFPLDTDV